MGVSRLRFTVVSAVLSGYQVELDLAEPITVGRTTENRIALDHKSVSRRHARIETNGDGLRVVDLQSHNGTTVNSQLVTERVLAPGDVLGFGEVLVKFEAVPAAGEAPQDAPMAGLPAILPAAAPTDMLPARPLVLEDVFQQAAPTQTMPTTAARKFRGTLLYAVVVISVIVLGAVAIWRVGYRPAGPEVLALQLRVGDALPVLIGPRVDPSGTRLLPGLTQVERVGEPDDERVAYVKTTKFHTFVAVYGRNVGTTDIRLYGPPIGTLVLRVLVRGNKPESDVDLWKNEPLGERRRRADELVARATEGAPTGRVNERTTRAIRWLEQAAALLEGDPARLDLYARLIQRIRDLREQRDKRFDELARLIDTRREEANYKACDEAAQELLRIFDDDQEVEYHVVRAFYETLLEERARAERRAQE